MKQLFSHEMHLVDAIGGSVHLTLREILALLTGRRALGFFAIALLALSVTDPPELLHRMPIYVAWIVWVNALLAYLVLYMLLLGVGGLIQQGHKTRPIYLPLISLLALLPSIFLAESLARLLSGTSDPILFDRLIYDYLSAQSFEIVYVRFVLPGQLARHNAALRASEPADRILQLGDQRVAMSKILHMAAQEHYVRVTHTDGSILHRARISDLVAQIDGFDGCQPHRSWWVSRLAAPALQRQNNRYILALSDGTSVPVARGRLKQVRDWQHGT